MWTNCWGLPSLGPHSTLSSFRVVWEFPHPSKCEKLVISLTDLSLFQTAFLSSVFNTNFKSFKQMAQPIRLYMHCEIIVSYKSQSDLKLFLENKSWLPTGWSSALHKMHCRPPEHSGNIFTSDKCFEIQSFIFISIRYSISSTRALLYWEASLIIGKSANPSNFFRNSRRTTGYSFMSALSQWHQRRHWSLLDQAGFSNCITLFLPANRKWIK